MATTAKSVTTTATSLPSVNIVSREFKADPYPFYAQLRAEAPVYRTVLPNKQPAWLITRYSDVMAVLKDDQRFVKNRRNVITAEQKAKQEWVPPMFRLLQENLVDTDGEQHARLRGLIHKAFTPRMIEGMQQRVQEVATTLLDQAQSRGKFDLIRDYATPVPLTIIAEIMGITQKDQASFHRWAKSLISLSGTAGTLLAIPNMMALLAYFKRLIKERRAKPDDRLISALVQAEEAGDQLSGDELVAMLFVLLIAGHETTQNLIGNGMLAMMQHPDQMAKLRQQPTLVGNAVEELLRYVSPVEQATERYAAEDVEMHGVTIPKGEMVLAVLASANRDETVFENADTLDIARQNVKQLDFGQGAHYCVGAPLARLEGQIAILTLVQRMPALRLGTAPAALRWRKGLTVRGLEALPVAF